ncbi:MULTISPECIES: LuxR C-terminal-related transcriptional regulator [unclassified Nocardioides]|uniref:LuxR C-terminal-related transcriptional regulator n=1 Tax=unclassified Nocardioides TaxID=2615069 RepID=UPI00301496C4
MSELPPDQLTDLPRLPPSARARPRLLQRLDQWLPLTVLHAPGGAGKTTLAAQWTAAARGRGESVAWYDAASGGADASALASLTSALVASGRRTALVVDRADALGPGGLRTLVERVRGSSSLHLVVALRAGHASVLRLRTEVESQVLTGADLALDADELLQLVDVPAPQDLLAWTDGHVGTVVSGLPLPGAGGGWSRERARAALGVRLDEVGSGLGLEVLATVADTAVPSAILAPLLARLAGDPLADLEQVGSVEVADDGLLVRTAPALREVLRRRVGLDAWGADLVGTVLRLRWWELLRDDPALLADLLTTLADDPVEAGPLATQLRVEGLVGPAVEPAPGTTRPDLAACTVRVLACRRRGDLPGARDAVRRGEALLTAGRPEAAVVRRFALEAGLACFEAGDVASARRWWLRAHAALAGETEAAALLALAAALEADHQALATWSGWAGPDESDAHRLARAIGALDRLELAEAGRELAAVSRTGLAGDLWYLVAAVGAELALMTPARSEALHVLRQQRAEHALRAPVGSMARCALDTAELDLLLATGRATEAATVLEWMTDSAATRLVRGRLALMAGDLEVAGAELAAVAHPPTSPRRLRMEALLLTAETHRRADRTAAARTAGDELTLRAPWPRLLELVPGGPVHPASVEVVQLTSREREILEMLRGPLPRDSIAAALFVSTNTVKTQLQALYRKLGATTREEAVSRAYALGLLD